MESCSNAPRGSIVCQRFSSRGLSEYRWESGTRCSVEGFPFKNIVGMADSDSSCVLPPFEVAREVSPCPKAHQIPSPPTRQTRFTHSKHRPECPLWCHLHISPEFFRAGHNISKMIIGQGGKNTGAIFERTGASIRVRGRGSGHFEKHGKEAPAPLMVAVTGRPNDPANFVFAVRMCIDLVERCAEDLILSGCVLSGPTWQVGNWSPLAACHLGCIFSNLGIPLPKASAQPQGLCRNGNGSMVRPSPC